MYLSAKRDWEPIGARTDKPGRVLVRVILADRHGTNVKGNITRTFSVHGAKVTEIAQITRNACQEVAKKVKASMDAEKAEEKPYSFMIR